MGSCLSNNKETKRVLIVGLDGSGKTTLLYSFSKKQEMTTVPTIGFNIESISYGKYILNMWDVGGGDKLRDLWHHYYPGTNAVIWVIDSHDHDINRINRVKDELHTLIKDYQMVDVIFAIVCNKRDRKDGCPPFHIEEIGDKLELFKYKDCDINFFKQIQFEIKNTLFDTYPIPDEILDIIAGYLPRLRDGKQFTQAMELFECNARESQETMEILEWITNTLV